MAITIRIITSVEVQDGNTSIESAIGSKAFEVAKSAEGGPTPGVVNLTTTVEKIILDELTTPGWCYLKNLGPDTIYWGYYYLGTLQKVGEMLIGESNTFRLWSGIITGNLFAMQAVTTTAQVEVLVWEN